MSTSDAAVGLAVGLAFVVFAPLMSLFDAWMREVGLGNMMTGTRRFAIAFCWLFAVVGVVLAVVFAGVLIGRLF